MKRRRFLDTNVLIYAADHAAGAKRRIASRLVREAFLEASGVVSTQVLQEYFVVATRKLGMSADQARFQVERYSRLDVVAVRVEHILNAIDSHQRHQISMWDALIVQAAHASGCDTILTEDLQDGSILEGVRVENPFLRPTR